MKYLRSTLRVGYLVISFALLLSLQPQLGRADQSMGLRFRELKITDTEFVVLQNNGSDPIQLSDYWLGYASNDQATSIVPSQQLPSGVLNPSEAIVLTNDATDTCDASVVSGLDFSSLSDSKGTIVLRYLQNNGATSTFTTVDQVNWSKPSASGTTNDNIDLRGEKGLVVPVWYKADDVTAWQVGDYDACSLVITVAATDPSTSSTQKIVWPQASSVVPGTIVSLATTSSGGTGKSLPAADKGLKSPQMSEILPNPASPKTDADDEFIELYNPNAKTFDLSGFVLQVGSMTSGTRHNYELPKGTTMAGKAFKAFYSKQTNLAINNSGGQVWLLDPYGTVI
ncbi:lamin tail domain-containing protein, partial [Candidatus Saccharibacteria bacterium]|nr:lamin tail domain-containing protein [Candidatus Saccharibacteria bacterium]